jgi:hypothetical protein
MGFNSGLKGLRLTVSSRTVDPQYGACFMSQFWHLEYGGNVESFEKSLERKI